MEARDLNAYVQIYTFTEVTDATLGTNHQNRVLLKSIWANVQPRTGSLLSGREAGTMLSKTTHVVTVRSKEVSNITDICEIEWTDTNGETHKFTIDYVIPPARNVRFTTIYCTEEIHHVQRHIV